MKRRRVNDGAYNQSKGTNAAGSVSRELLESVKVARNKEVVQRVIREVFNKKQYDLIEQYYDRNCTFPAVVKTYKGIPKAMREAGIRNPKETLADNKDGQALQIVKTACKFYSTAFPDLHYTITSLIGEGDTVAVHWEVTGHHLGPLTLTPDCIIQPTGNEINVSATAIIKLKNDKIVEVRQNVDQLALFQQLNVLDQLYLLQPNATQQPCRTATGTAPAGEDTRTTPPLTHHPPVPVTFSREVQTTQLPAISALRSFGRPPTSGYDMRPPTFPSQHNAAQTQPAPQHFMTTRSQTQFRQPTQDDGGNRVPFAHFMPAQRNTQVLSQQKDKWHPRKVEQKKQKD